MKKNALCIYANKTKKLLSLCVCSIFLLSACGGGGSSPQNSSTAPQENSSLSSSSISSQAKSSLSSSSISSPAKSSLSSSSASSSTGSLAPILASPFICNTKTNSFTVLSGDLVIPKDNCGTYIGYTNMAPGSYSIGQFEYSRDLSDQVDIEGNFRRLYGNESRPVEIYFLGGAFGWANNGTQSQYYFYESETHWSGWQNSDLFNIKGTNRVKISQTGQVITAFVNGVELGKFSLTLPVNKRRVSVFFKGDPGVKESMEFEQLSVTDRNVDLSTPIVLPTLMPPMSVKAVRGDGYIDVSWVAIQGASSYDIWREISPEQPVAYANVESNSFRDTKLINGSQYCYYISSQRKFSNSYEVTGHPAYACVVASVTNADPVKVNGVCGSSNQSQLLNAPSAIKDLCESGTSSNVIGNGPWTWSCNGIGSSTTSASCSARKSLDLPSI